MVPHWEGSNFATETKGTQCMPRVSGYFQKYLRKTDNKICKENFSPQRKLRSTSVSRFLSSERWWWTASSLCISQTANSVTSTLQENVLFTSSQDHMLNSEEGTGKLTAPCQDSGKGFSKTGSPFEGVLPNSTPTEPSEVSLIPLSVIIDLLAGPAVIQSSGGGGTTNDLDWNDERRRREEARENRYIHKPFKLRRWTVKLSYSPC